MLHNKIILLTGGSAGIGRACAQAYAANGATVCIADKQSAAEALPGHGHLFIRCDVSNEAEVKTAIAQVIATHGRLDAIHNNAGITHPSRPLHETTDDEWDLLFKVNLKSILYTVRHGIQHLIETKGCLLNTSSMVGDIGQDNHAAYVATKGGVNALTKAMALDYAPLGVRVNAISPAAIKTEALEAWSKAQPGHEKIQQYLDHLHPLGKMPEGDVIADTAVFLLSNAARFITGCIMPVSGGAELGYRTIL
ncbi:NAD(P)-dependent dehydrogenase, short-chain alcohol dehydrogenase family [Chitinophaga jiangningensis]|uniref:NAD(P)-dependent dehydrogenase, short-chain alcohol dehydrogenase family n=1 Tax=Chitinophaga jiangningensis TaxID=1419482 RepID=A0A1M7LAC2_9BACT|nr:SDR family oxidoreductase [Chitinophaga jiangningensis]SHM74937.1 NAD(P)-dependent dehydrogenase, short-chain alcohol dehydrogenase family [Chitinophaga jiangningensis]